MSSTEAKTDKIIHLRDLLRERFPGAHASPARLHPLAAAPVAAEVHPEFPLGVTLFDSLDGGLGPGRGTLTEIVVPPRRTGAGSLIAGLIQAASTAERRFPLGLVDAADSFDPTALSDSPASASALCRRLCWIRCQRQVEKAVKAVDLLLRDGNLPVLLLDLQLCSPADIRRSIPGGHRTWHRLRTLAEQAGTILLSFTPEPMIPSSAWRLEIHQRWSLDAIDRLPLTNDLRHEPIRHSTTRARPALGTAEWAMAG